MHLALAEELIRKKQWDDYTASCFRLGSVVADTMERSEKRISHFWNDDELVKINRAPAVERFVNQYPDYKENPFLYGYYCHLQLDYEFVKGYWKKHFIFLDKNMMETNIFEFVRYAKVIDDGRIYSIEEFLSDQYYYGDYDIMNPWFIEKYKVKPLEISLVEEDAFLRLVENFKEIDFDQSKSYLHKMNETINKMQSGKKVAQQTKVFKYTEICEMIERLADTKAS